MIWDAYTIFAVVSGVTLLVVAATPFFDRKERLESVLFGVAILGYGIYIGTTDGSFRFPLILFVLPFVFLGVGALNAYRRWEESRATAGTDTADTAQPTGTAQPTVTAQPTGASAPAPSPVYSAFSPGAATAGPSPSRPFLYSNAERP